MFLTVFVKVFVVLKKSCRIGKSDAFPDDGRTKPKPKMKAPHSPKAEDLCLFRARLGDKKISTVVSFFRHPQLLCSKAVFDCFFFLFLQVC